MSVPSAIRIDTRVAYRRLIKVAEQVTRDCPLYQTEGLRQYVGRRFLERAERNRQQYRHLLHDGSGDARGGRRKSQKQRVLTAQYGKFIAKELQQVHGLAELLLRAPGNTALTSMLQVLSAGVGNVHYQQTVERNYVRYCQFEEKKLDRDEVEEEATSDRQNRIMQHALIPYGERLLILHRLQETGGGRDAVAEPGRLTSWQVTEAIVGTRSGVTAHHMSHGKENVVVEVDETFNKQIVYVRCETYDWSRDVERVEIAEAEELRGTVFHAEYLSVALRLCDALMVETPLHAYRSTVLVGHGVGGAVAFCLALLLHARGFDVKNCVTLGAPKCIQKSLARYVHAVNPIRVVLEGDPLIELPVTGAEGDPFVHCGEILLMDNRARADLGSEADMKTREAGRQSEGGRNESTEDLFTAESLSDSLDASEEPAMGNEEGCVATGDYNDEGDVGGEDLLEQLRLAAKRYSEGFLVNHYVEHLTDTTVRLTYAEGDEVWDEGDYAQMKREDQLGHSFSGSQKWQDELRSPV
ncbi:hypothetical protein, conserved [Trypanosoma brucei brucei TREU927]|uniref:Fungal lipase-type domain-containing protein n=1 Tax=Trypanosoma brucei brucei (strain 927/4 GUTat10.1) TaxID=185431 RepID=Q38D50_TRYB2|nr:hypothetical protein, conserved [Trypanosoma brucei brucei TREU927]EAN77270.1 hypothetical protein, conserved [Trypanosoma brucei brucei TREU927]